MAKMFVLRHAQSAWNAEHRWTGQCDPPLSSDGRIEAERLAARFLRVGFKTVVCSDLLRARETGEILGAAFGVEPITADGLRERGAGVWEGRTSAEIEAEFPGELARWRLGQVVHPEGGENWNSYSARVLQSLGRVAAPTRGPVLVVAHLGTLRVLESHLAVHPLPTHHLVGV